LTSSDDYSNKAGRDRRAKRRASHPRVGRNNKEEKVMPELNNDKNVYLLGAGFSKEVGLPLQDDFLLVAKEVYFKNPALFKHFEKVFEYQDKLTKMKKYLNYPLLNLEHLFNLIEMDIFYSASDESAEIKSDFTRLVCDVLTDKTPCPLLHDQNRQPAVNKIYDPYVKFINLLIKNDRRMLEMYDDTIISFNYDLVLEGAACIYNWKRRQENKHANSVDANFIRFNTTFGKTNITADPVSDFFIKNRPGLYCPPMNLFSKDEGSLKLIKLHGSINWKTVGDGKTFIVPPTWNKSDSEIRLLWEYAYKELMAAKRIIVIGYSFPETDIYVKSLLALALNENKLLQNIYFINPNEDIAKNSAMALLDKYFEKYCAYHPWKFSKLVGSDDGKKFIEESLNRKLIS
jgi:hypothetical protein